MLRLILAALVCLASTQVAAAQTSADACHVYLIDREAAGKASDAYDRAGTDKGREQALASGWLKILGEFSPKVGEEELTTKSYPLPGGKVFVTASVFYTDEMMPSATTADSMLLGIVIADKPQTDALSVLNAAVAEVTYNQFVDTVRVKTNVSIKGHSYLVGLQCSHQVKQSEK